ncbi:S8 family peptidase [Halovivax gelatinilyticus]|uniref:S8 family peptidase n=1 Tax=Halovivax gelatinilyticus TaxID=2961597 RepID=UPI0020CA6D13|nr:S8 family peptidase [Halovivax gelatinilyticus]
MARTNITRRRILRGAAAGAATVGLAGKTTADESIDRTIIGLTADADFGVATANATEVRHRLDFGDIGKSVAGQFPDSAVRALENNPNVRYVEKDQPAYALQTTPYGIEQVSADVAHANGETGAGASIAIIDTGVQVDHEALDVHGGAAFGTTCSNCPEPYGDDNGHGTHCAGTAVAPDDGVGVLGVSLDSELYAVKVLDSTGGGSLSDVAEGIVWTADQGIDVGSLSLGGGSGTQELQDACQYANQQGTLLVAAAGNDGECSNCVSYPAAYDEVVAVSATDENDDLASFSSTGPEVDLAAPGVDVYSTYTNNGYDTLSGTSMACPHVSGGAAHLMANGYSNSEARQQLMDTADDICRCDEDQGAGRLNVAAALGLESPEDCSSGTIECQNDDGGGGCFITTATAGEGETLDSLRRFRDDSMSATPMGRALVDLYYRISPPIADTLAAHPDSATSRVTRGIVDVCASLSDAQAETDSRLKSASLGVALTSLYMVGITVGAGGHAGITAREKLSR